MLDCKHTVRWEIDEVQLFALFRIRYMGRGIRVLERINNMLFTADPCHWYKK